MDKNNNRSSCPKCGKAGSDARLIRTTDGAVILYGRDDKKLTYKVKNNKNYDL